VIATILFVLGLVAFACVCAAIEVVVERMRGR
jgi:hypothetical protein